MGSYCPLFRQYAKSQVEKTRTCQCRVHRADLSTKKDWATGLATFTYLKLKKICGDGGYRGSFVCEAYKYFGLRVEISKKFKAHGWQVLPKRWREHKWL